MSRESGKILNRLNDIYSRIEVTDADVDTVLNIMDDLKTREYAEMLTKKYLQTALKSFKDTKIAKEFQEDFKELIDFLAIRNY